MKAIFYEKHGDADVLQYGEQPKPEVKDGHILIRVHAASVNQVDWKMRAGSPLPVPVIGSPAIPGRDVAGEVVEIGKNVTPFKVGDKVFGMLSSTIGGAYAEFAVMPADVAVVMPANLNYKQAAAVPLTALTALQALRDKGELEPGERVLINGASSAVGIFAVQIAKALGAGEVIGTCSSDHIKLVKDLGADQVIDYKKEDFTKHKESYDLILDAVAKRTFAESKDSLTENGRYVTTVPNPKDIMGYVTSLFTDRKPKTMMVKDQGEDLALIKDWIETGSVKPIIDKVFSLKDAADAQRYSEKESASGKIIIEVIPDEEGVTKP
ncbi:NAD(P)-dependent alcohol dehydrogenase [Pontibacter silvestris]|uniref:NAD(P)-dependent alcohol dehydrogenase n=1 Tax=Pontibacter silvestris TaxID=2305183 RepID=A0ABW4X2Q6_9BACT|nr:NAD(P)-dependent alcohol dehydrogenase [Pontibacter silvestris]MCC9138316.1 NAD(P)-dependent alcohol dehydrogenase [Pontibacter silvestris]